MANGIWTTIHFGGKLKRSDISDLAELMYDNGGEWPDIETDEMPIAAKHELDMASREERHAIGYAGESNHGDGDGLPEMLRKLGLTYRHTVEHDCNEGGTISIWKPGMDGPDQVGHLESDPAITLTSLLKAEALSVVIARLSPFAEDVPPLEIVEG